MRREDIAGQRIASHAREIADLFNCPMHVTVIVRDPAGNTEREMCVAVPRGESLDDVIAVLERCKVREEQGV